MKIGMYNRYLSTLGGGEKHSLAIAEFLSQKHQVEVISHKTPPKERIEALLAVDLARVDFLTIPDRAAVEVAAISKEYDLFINSSYMDFFPPLSKYSAALIFFPAKLNLSVLLRRQVKQIARWAFQIPDMTCGLQYFEMLRGGILWYLDTYARIDLPPWVAPYRVCFDVESLDPRIHQVDVQVNRQALESLRLPATGQLVHCEVTAPAAPGHAPALSLQVPAGIHPDGQPKLRITNLDLGLPAHQLYMGFFEHHYRGWATRFHKNPPAMAMIDYMKRYDVLWANSEFTRRWIHTYWRLNSEVLYPLVDVDQLRPGTKTQTILNVGRFFSGNHNKKHLEMVKAFRQLVDAGLRGWEFHLAGGTAPEEIHQAYYREVEEAARGYPIVLHPNFPRSDLLRLYAQSTIYWHASGYGEDENENPDRFEHFGITTVEAMASGCCPVVIAKGGQPEIVRHGQNGFLWNSLDELKQLTLNLIQSPALRAQIASQAVASSARFGRQNFQTRLSQSLDRIIQQVPPRRGG